MASLREAIFPRIAAERDRALHWLLAISGQAKLLDDKSDARAQHPQPLPRISIRSIIFRSSLLRRYRSGQTDERTKRGIHLTITASRQGCATRLAASSASRLSTRARNATFPRLVKS